MKSLAEIAKELDVSPSAVSFVYHGKWREQRISEGLAARIQKALDRGDCRPNALGTQLRSGRTMTVGVILPDLSRSFSLALLKGVEEELDKRGYLALLSNSCYGAKELSALSSILSRGVDGVIMTPCVERENLLRLLGNGRGRIPTVFVDNQLPGSGVDSVSSDNEKAAMCAVERCVAEGGRRIAYLGSARRMSALDERFNGYAKALRKAGLPVSKPLVRRTMRFAEGGAEALESLWSRRQVPDALFVESFLYFAEGFRFLAGKGIKVSGDLLLTGFDDPVPALRLVPEFPPGAGRIAFIEQDAERMGLLAARRLFDILDGKSGRFELRLKPELKFHSL